MNKIGYVLFCEMLGIVVMNCSMSVNNLLRFLGLFDCDKYFVIVRILFICWIVGWNLVFVKFLSDGYWFCNKEILCESIL